MLFTKESKRMNSQNTWNEKHNAKNANERGESEKEYAQMYRAFRYAKVKRRIRNRQESNLCFKKKN